MGTLHYGAAAFDVDDETLRHFAAVAAAKLRRHEPFLALLRSDDDGAERVWMHPAVDLRISTAASDAPLEPRRLEHMMHGASTPGGLDLCTPWHAPTAAGRR